MIRNAATYSSALPSERIWSWIVMGMAYKTAGMALVARMKAEEADRTRKISGLQPA